MARTCSSTSAGSNRGSSGSKKPSPANPACTAVASLFLGAPVLSSAVLQFDIPVLGHVKLVTALFFDLGVYLIVVGLVLDVLRSLGARVDVEMAGVR